MQVQEDESRAKGGSTLLPPCVSSLPPDGRQSQSADDVALWTARISTSTVDLGEDEEPRKGMVCNVLNFKIIVVCIFLNLEDKLFQSWRVQTNRPVASKIQHQSRSTA